MKQVPGTCLLRCSHNLGGTERPYNMNCDIVRPMADGRLKIKVYGERYWRDRYDKVSYRYVEPGRISPKKETAQFLRWVTGIIRASA